MNNQSGLIVFAKKPVLGQVKTRLQPQIPPEISLEIYRFFVEETLEKVNALQDTSLWLGCFPDRDDPWFLDLSRRYPLRLFNQKGEDLGARMEAAFDLLNREKIRKKVIIGTDTPHLPLKFIRSGFEILNQVDVSIGPSRDGGYYLLGISGNSPAIFNGISWSNDSVLKSTIRILEQKKIPFQLLPEWYDIDRFEDLVSLEAYWKSLKMNGGEVPDRFFQLLNGVGSTQKTVL